MQRKTSLLLTYLAALDASEARYVVWHAGPAFPEVIESDVDLCVLQDDLSDALRVLREIATAHGCLIVQSLQHESTWRYVVVAIPRPQGGFDFLHLDIGTDFRRDGRVYVTSEKALSCRRRVGGIWFPDSVTELDYYFVKRVSKRSIGSQYANDLRALWEAAGPKAETVLTLRVPRQSIGVVRDALMTGDWSAIDLNRLRRSIISRAFWSDVPAAALYAWNELRRVRSRLLHPTGLHVVTSGPDGVGKSAVLDALQERLAPAFRGVVRMHLRPSVLPARGGRLGASGPVAPYGKTPYGPVRSAAKVLYLAFDYTLGYWLRVRLRLLRSTLVLCDRWVLDIVVDPLRVRISPERRALLAVLAHAPRPDISLVLEAPAALIRERKQELTSDRIEYLARRYHVEGSTQSGVHFVSAVGSVEDVSNECARIVLEHLAERLDGGTW